MNSDIIQLGDVSFDPNTRTLTYKDGRPAQLRNKSKAVLTYLLENPNHTVTKADILRDVWSGIHVSDESIVQCIADIRRLVGVDARAIIETVPREGYRINVSRGNSPPKRVMLALSFIVCLSLFLAALVFWPDRTAQPDEPEQTADAETSTNPPGTDNTEAFLEVLKGRLSANRFSRSESLIAERHFRRAIDLDPAFARAYAELGTLLAVRFENDWTVILEADKEKALFYAEKAISLDPASWLGHYALGRLHSVFADLDAAESHLEAAMSLQPDNEDARAYYGIVKNFRGEAESAVAILEQAVTSHPDPPYWYYLGLGNALFNIGRNEAAEVALNRCLELSRNSPYCLRYLIAVLGEMDRQADAGAAARAYEAMGFEMSVGSIMTMMTFHHRDSRGRLKGALRRAGLPE